MDYSEYKTIKEISEMTWCTVWAIEKEAQKCKKGKHTILINNRFPPSRRMSPERVQAYVDHKKSNDKLKSFRD
jgi:hypothetical protein